MGGSFGDEILAPPFSFPRAMDCPPRTPSSPLAMEPSDEAGEPFHCVICLELVYKPIVQSCGHVFCFWCVHLAMDNRRQSLCPVCRRPYMHFPRVCELLHFMLLKAVPEEYERRGQEIQGMEEERQVFSPRFLESPRQPWSPRDLEQTDRVKSQKVKLSRVRGAKVQSCAGASPADASSLAGTSGVDNAELAGNDETRSFYPEVIASGRATGIGFRKGNSGDTDCTINVLTVDDFSCSSCNRLLYRPVVLNCGEVFCESCLKSSTGSSLRCPSCKVPHRGGSVLVCLELHHYLERAFPIDYSGRREDVMSQQLVEKDVMSRQLGEEVHSLECSAEDTTGAETEVNLHVGVGCDGCGMFPIVGDRFQCQDCAEKIGYDLCGTCHRKGGGISGRFNQQHVSSHRMKEVARPQKLVLNMVNGLIQRRRIQQHLVGDLDDYINSFVD